MTNLADHVTSLELSKKLKELGFKQDSLFYWVKSERKHNDFREDYTIMFSADVFSDYCDQRIHCPDRESVSICTFYKGSIMESLDSISAYTASELLYFMPPGCKIYLSHKEFYCDYNSLVGSGTLSGTSEFSAADTAARTILYLLKNDLMELPK